MHHVLENFARPELRALSGATRTLLGVPVVDGGVPDRWSAPLSHPFLCADERRALWIHQGASCYVELGQPIIMQAGDLSRRLEYDYMVYAMALRTMLVQRRRYCLHASAVVSPDGVCVAVMGESMAGKTTTVVELISRGWTFVCDDVLEVEAGEAGLARIVPHDRPVHLSDAAAVRLGAEPSIGRPLPGRDKRAYLMTGNMERRPLDFLVLLSISDAIAVRARRMLDVTEAAWQIAGHNDVWGLCHIEALKHDFFMWTTRLASSVPMYEVARPPAGDTVTRVADAIVASANQMI